MDYVFFAFSAMCLGLAVLLALILLLQPERHLGLWQLILAGLTGVAYYYLEINVFQNYPVWFYLANMLPQAVLLL